MGGSNTLVMFCDTEKRETFIFIEVAGFAGGLGRESEDPTPLLVF